MNPDPKFISVGDGGKPVAVAMTAADYLVVYKSFMPELCFSDGLSLVDFLAGQKKVLL